MIPTEIQRIFLLSRANGTDNRQDLLPVNGWKWPDQTWLQRRLAKIKEKKEANNEQI